MLFSTVSVKHRLDNITIAIKLQVQLYTKNYDSFNMINDILKTRSIFNIIDVG